jgi:PIN domain nuclease of toxin-antitoxin system
MNKLKILVDTHIILWAFSDPKRISAKMQTVLKDDTNDIYYSPVSLWEIAIKHGLGKLDIEDMSPEEFYRELTSSYFICKPLSNETIISSYKLPMYHRDPFDRMLIWEAISSDMTLLSADTTIDTYQAEGLKTIH